MLHFDQLKCYQPVDVCAGVPVASARTWQLHKKIGAAGPTTASFKCCHQTVSACLKPTCSGTTVLIEMCWRLAVMNTARIMAHLEMTNH